MYNKQYDVGVYANCLCKIGKINSYTKIEDKI